MCGIVGYIGDQNALDVLVSGLEKLEYRGYDSAGVAVWNGNDLRITRALGKLKELKKALHHTPLEGSATLGIGHTRWATHGKPSENNAHPHSAGRICLIHNGIIENYIELRERLSALGCSFSSETDTEIAAHLVHYYVSQGEDPFAALKHACSEIRGSYAFLVIDKEHPDRIFIAKNSTPIVIGIGSDEMFIASDIPAILGSTREIMILEDGDFAIVSRSKVSVEHSGRSIERPIQHVTWDPVTAQKGGFKHYMLKEIHEQPDVVSDTIRGRMGKERPEVLLPELELGKDLVQKFKRVVIASCGTAWHAALTAKFYIETFAKLPCEIDYASEYRYRSPLLDDSTLFAVISQSGETADTLAVLDAATGHAKTLAICNVLGSSIARKAEHVLYTHAGPEISVASTKAYMTQLVAAKLLAIFLGQQRGVLDEETSRALTEQLRHLPAALRDSLQIEDQVEQISRKYHGARDFLYIARGVCYPTALEGALKLKEISYIHAEGYPAGELKHGPIALIDEKMPVVVVLQKSDVLFDKTLSNLREVESRGGRIIAVTDVTAHKELHSVAEDVIEVPFLSEYLSPMLLTVPLQMLAYYIAVFNGTDVDLPRNLAKSVTVE